MTIKKTKCKCGKDYIDFDNQLGNCPDCAEDKKEALVRQEILKQFTYLTVDSAFKLVLRMLVTEVIARRECYEGNKACDKEVVVPMPTPVIPEARGFFSRIFRRK